MSIVTIYQSFSVSSHALIFKTEEEATAYIKNDFQREIELAEEQGNSSVVNSSISYHDDWAKLEYESGDFIEWTLADITDMRG